LFKGKNAVLCICGGIAAYKTAELVRYLKKNNADVNVIMTESATKFITPLTMQTLSCNPVITDMFSDTKEWDVKHVSLAAKADILIIAPATANIIGKIANGIADDMATTTVMATKSKVLFIPAMNTNMYENEIVKENIQKLKKLGYLFTEPGEGILACGDTGKGRYPETGIIESEIEKILLPMSGILNNKKILITAGPTREQFDDVRFFSNPSSGKMGYAIAESAIKRGMQTILITGPVSIDPPEGVEITSVSSAEEMYNAVKKRYAEVDIAVFSAAVADYMPEKSIKGKMKKDNNGISINMIRTPDIAMEMSKIKEGRINIGFSAESENLIENAKEKLINKKFDLIIANDITKKDSGFESDNNTISVINKEKVLIESVTATKKVLADIILKEIENIIKDKEENKE
jgi:phosphopantothenoylcysteine decarboxylase/phosphopantothenate--cysteine ligase